MWAIAAPSWVCVVEGFSMKKRRYARAGMTLTIPRGAWEIFVAAVSWRLPQTIRKYGRRREKKLRWMAAMMGLIYQMASVRVPAGF